MGRVNQNELQRGAVDERLQRLELATREKIFRIVGDKPENEGVGITRHFRAVRIIWVDVNTRPARVLNQEQIPFIVRMNSLVARLAEHTVEGSHYRRPVGGDLDHAAAGPVLL